MKLVIGCGYLGLRVAKLWIAAGEQVAATTRSATRVDEFTALGIAPIVADVTQRETLKKLPVADRVLFAVGYDRSAAASQNEVYVEGLRNVLTEFERRQVAVDRLIYISTTGVYGEAGGDWVDEATPCAPTTPGGQAHFAAEQILAASLFGSRSIILRMAGLYGPGRVPRSADLLAGRPIALPPDHFLNLIHIDDAAQAVVAAGNVDVAATGIAEHSTMPRVFNVSDGCPLKRREYLDAMAAMLGAPPPVFAAPVEASPAVRGATNRRISNRRLVDNLKIEFRFPNAALGLADAFDGTEHAAAKRAMRTRAT
jgi:nucleoside-diphosphate-sugar epimerase